MIELRESTEDDIDYLCELAEKRKNSIVSKDEAKEFFEMRIKSVTAFYAGVRFAVISLLDIDGKLFYEAYKDDELCKSKKMPANLSYKTALLTLELFSDTITKYGALFTYVDKRDKAIRIIAKKIGFVYVYEFFNYDLFKLERKLCQQYQQ